MSESISRGPFIDVPTFNALFPAEGSKAIPVTLDFQTGAPAGITVDLTQAFQMKRIELVQTVFIDNSRNGVAVTMDIAGSNQRLVCPARAQGYFPVLAPTDAKLRFASLGATGLVYAFILNVPISAAVWNTTANTPTFDVNGAMMVSDALLDATVVGGQVSVRNFRFGSGDVAVPDLMGTAFYSAGLTTAGSTTIATAAPGLIITGVQMYLSGAATLATAAEYVVTINLGAAAALRGIAYLPAATPGTIPSRIELLDLTDIAISAKNAAETLTVVRSAALTGGALYVNVQYALTSFVG